ncbi:glycosyltransferase family 4 protein [Desulfurivibrio alkaliphilus]|uniref:Glycosyl transferase group 1 n=1 Tax=Desulfurivibrio alkaliphilus (strain DSM 19089 / UNIQEM U267 / AHT2) TaxID=589865 RepID=D6YZS3_DESAT|nr:glycosyltransferase family 1 protein [Desulfurivibrio alkaliphilus]ADH85080.1 glycosyl transferase group 1 [Desulfurivibrio alkaliphilus AHT 2]
MKKIGIFLEVPPHFGGTFQYTQTMLDAVAALPRDRFTVVAGYVDTVWRDYLEPYTSVKKIHIPRGFWGRALGLAWLLLRLPMGPWRRLCPWFHPMAKAMLKEQCDLWIFPAQDARSFQMPVPALVTVLDVAHLYDGQRFPEAASRWELLYRIPLYANICRWAKGVIVLSPIDKQQVMESFHLAEERIHIMPMVVPRYIEVAKTPPDFELRYQLPAKYLFYPAQFWEHKNHKKMLRALATLKPELPDLKLVLVGSPKNAWDSVLQLIKELDLAEHVLILGYVPDADMPELYRRARALIYASCYGPTNLPPLEAMALGCPMALAKVTCMPDRVGDAALVFHQDSVAEMADCIRRLWTDDGLCADLSERGKARAAQWKQPQFNQRLEEIVAGLTTDKGGKKPIRPAAAT